MGGLVRGGDGLVLNKYRSLADPLLSPIARKLKNVNPDTLSWIAFSFAIAAGYLFWAAGEYDHDLLLVALLAVILNSVLDALDGWVARLTGKASKRGDFLDHVLDRYADAFIFGGIVLSAYCHFTVGFIAMLGVIFTSYMGTQSQALGLKRDYGGMLGRADRLVLLFIAILAQWAWIVATGEVHVVTLDIAGTPYQITILEGLMIFIAVAGNLTAVQRAVASWKDLKEVEMEVEEAPPDGSVDAGGAVDVEDDAPDTFDESKAGDDDLGSPGTG